MTEDPYATARTNLRDNVKTLITMFGGVSAVLLAGTPFTGFAGIRDFGIWFSVACVALITAVGLLLWAVQVLLFVLRPDTSSWRLLGQPSQEKETVALQASFRDQKADLLPANAAGVPMASPQQLFAAARQAQIDYITSVNESESADDRAFADFHKQRYEGLRRNLEIINFWISFTRLHWRVQRGIEKVTCIGIGALVAIGLFVIASSWAAKTDKPAAPTIYVVTPYGADAPPTSKPPACSPLKPIMFATGKAQLIGDDIDRITVARKCLRDQPGLGILIFANTDTVGGGRVNAGLAAQRAETVAAFLRSVGGISPSRIFVTPLAKADLPALTQPGTAKDVNRSVEMIAVPLPARTL